MYKTSLENYTLSFHGRLWIQVLSQNVFLRSIIDCLVAMNGPSITFLYKQKTHCFKVLYPRRAQTFKFFRRWTNKIFLSYNSSFHFQQMQKLFSFSLVQNILSGFSANVYVTFSTKIAKHKKTYDKISENKSWLPSVKRIAWKQRSDFLSFERKLQLIEVVTAPGFNHLLRFGAVCSLCTTIKLKCSVSYKERISEVSSWKKAPVPNWFA